MAIEERPRENLLEEATAYRRRILLRVKPVSASLKGGSATHACEVFVGLRSGGGWSVYFDDDPVLQFNAGGELRRLFLGGKRFTSDNGRLNLLTRGARGGRVSMESSCVDAKQTRELLSDCSKWLVQLDMQLQAGAIEVVGQVPADDLGLIEEVRAWVRQVAKRELSLANQPRV